MQKTSTFVLLLHLIVCSSAYSQSESLFDKIRKVPVLTPEAASFAKYVEFPVNLYNGIPNISIPLYTIQSGDISLPITLSYHAGGIKVSEEASWVGLGWNLSAGGMISRQINGRDDNQDPSTNYFDVVFPGDTNYFENNVNRAIFGGCDVYDGQGRGIVTSYPGLQLWDLISRGEGEPDTYIYNFAQFSGKFVNAGFVINKIDDVDRNNIRFDVTPNAIVAITPDGYKYEFNDLEKSWVGTNPFVVTGYYLSKITSPKGKVVNFSYEFINDQRTLTSYSEEYMASYRETQGGANGSDGPIRKTKSYNNANLVYLTKIDFDEGYIDFVRNTRSDMNGKRLERIDIKYKDGTLLKNFTFTHSYFVGSSTRHYLEPTIPADPAPYPDDFIKKRLRLDALVETGNDPNVPPKPYAFEYYDGGTYTLPYKTSWAADYWGYYNGISNSTFIPSSKGFHLTSLYESIKNYSGANREPSEEPMKAGTLKKITYPTKGWTEYSYSAHRYTNNYSAPSKFNWMSINNVVDIGTGMKEATFTLSTAREVTLDVSLYCDCSSNVCACSGPETWNCGSLMISGYNSNVLYAELRKLNTTTGNYDFISWDFTWDVSDILPCGGSGVTNSGDFRKTTLLAAGTYKIIANYPDSKTGSLGSKMSFISVGYWDEYYEPNPVAGGLRVSQIKHHDAERNVDLVSSYEYIDGLLMHFPVFSWKKPQYLPESGPPEGFPSDPFGNYYYKYYFDYLYSNSVIPYSSSASGNGVGYSKVVEKRENGIGGWTEFLYENYADNFNFGNAENFQGYINAYAPGIPSTPHLKNGFLKESTVFDNSGNPLKKTVNTPLVLLGESFWSYKGEACIQAGTDFPNEPCNSLLGNAFIYYFYPIQMGKVVPSQTTEYNYSAGASQAVTTTYAYNSTGYRSSEQVTGNDGRVRQTEYKYLSDYVTTSGWLKDLSDRNKQDEPLEVYAKVNGNVVRGTFVKYQTVNGKTLPNEVYGIETKDPSVVASTAPNGVIPSKLKLMGTIVSDANGNTSYSVAKDNMVTSYIWGYKNTFPIAVVQNAMPNQVYHSSFEELTSSFSVTSVTGRKSYSGTAAFTVPLPSAGTYKLTYWIKNGAANWQYIEDTMSASKAIGGGTNVLIDEVRVYPASAQMTTYTYDVLLGMTSGTDPNGVKMSYSFDGLGRLQAIRDKDENILKVLEYRYKN